MSNAGGRGILMDVRATRTIGLGHLVRSLELATRFREVGMAVHFLPPGSRLAEARIRAEGFGIAGSRSTLEIPAAIIVDRPDAASSLFAAHRRKWPTAKLIALDYYERGAARPDAVVNLNRGRETRPDLRRSGARKLRGLAYATLRRSFRDERLKKRAGAKAVARRALIAFGGTDPFDWASVAVSALAPQLSPAGLSLDVLSPAKSRSLGSAASLADKKLVRVRASVSNPATLLAGCDIAIVGGGTLMMEAACLGVPAVVVPRTPEEKVFADQFARAGAVIVLHTSSGFPSRELAESVSALSRDRAKRRRMAAAGRKLIDGRGAERVVSLALGLTRNPS